jgi:hypothetical protein
MKKQLLLSLIFTLFCGIIYGQHLIRMNNNPAADPDYTTLQAANDNANPGDTIYMEGSTIAYDGANIDRKLVIIGPGYFLSDNDSTQANSLDANINGSLVFLAESAGSTITGIIGNHIDIRASNIAFTRCKVSTIYFNGEIENILVTQNFATMIYAESYSAKITNSVISNNIVYYYINANSNSGSLQILNNVVQGIAGAPISVYNSTISNNILTSTTNKLTENTGNVITNNIFAYAGTNANGNKYSITMSTVFVDFSGSLNYSDDAKWKLKAGSPAIGAGVSGVDCGAFGGPTPYVLSGIPALPHIYEAAIPGVGYSGTGLSCTIKIKAGK